MSKYVIDNDTLTAIGDAIRTVEESTDAIPVVEIPNRILTLEKPGGEDGIVLRGDISSAFISSCWRNKDILKNFTTEDVTNASRLFYCNSSYHTEIPSSFVINFKSDATYTPISDMFCDATLIKSLPKMVNCKPNGLSKTIYRCHYLTTEDISNFYNSLDFSYIDDQKTNKIQEFCCGCYSLRSATPILNILYHDYYSEQSSGYQNTIYNYCFQGCVSLDEILNLRVCDGATWTNNVNVFGYSFVSSCYRLKNLTFETNEDGTPKIVSWRNLTIDLSELIGYAYPYHADRTQCKVITDYNSGITIEKKVYDDATYQTLKDDPDWWTLDLNYSRYNHDSAVATINSLPDTSAYLAEKGGTNTIKFLGASGTSTDGGAINTLTEEEIAVAAAKGWTVTLV